MQETISLIYIIFVVFTDVLINVMLCIVRYKIIVPLYSSTDLVPMTFPEEANSFGLAQVCNDMLMFTREINTVFDKENIIQSLAKVIASQVYQKPMAFIHNFFSLWYNLKLFFIFNSVVNFFEFN